MTERSIAYLSTSSGAIKYPNPFFDLSKNYMPKSVKTMFSYCRTFYYTNDFVNNVVRKLTEYPITDIIFEDVVNKKTEQLYVNYFEQKLHIKDLLISIGLDYFTYGNCFINAHLKFKRILVDDEGSTYNFEELTKIQFKNGKIHATFKGDDSGRKLILSIEDIPIKNVDGLKFTRINPDRIDIVHDEFTGESEYYYAIPDDLKKKVRANKVETLKTTPKVILDAIANRKKVKLSKTNLFHFKAPTLAEEDAGWGKPQILPAMKKLYYMATLMRGNEAIAVEHIVPKKTIFPSPSGAFDPHNISMSKWTSAATENIKKWKMDPNHIAIMPIPLGYQELGGTGRAMLLTPELKFLEETIINGLGVPIEFVKGGASWTGSSVSLRIIENHFLNYRERLEDFLNYFLISKITEFLGFERCKIKLARMRMNDDSEAKQMAMNLNSAQKLSDETLLKELHYDPDKEKQRIREEAGFKRELATEDARAAAEAQGQAQLIIAKYQVQAQAEAADERARQDEKLFSAEVEEELGVEEEGIHQQIKKLAMTILMMPDPKMQQKALEALYQESPVTYNLVSQRIGQVQAEQRMAEAEASAYELKQEKQRIDMAQDAMSIQENTTATGKIRPRNEDKSGPKRDAQSGKAKV